MKNWEGEERGLNISQVGGFLGHSEVGLGSSKQPGPRCSSDTCLSPRAPRGSGNTDKKVFPATLVVVLVPSASTAYTHVPDLQWLCLNHPARSPVSLLHVQDHTVPANLGARPMDDFV